MIKSKSHSCYGCAYYSSGNCMWFVEHKEVNAKKIPADMLDKGCKKRKPKIEGIECNDLNTTKIVAYIIERFKGEFI